MSDERQFAYGKNEIGECSCPAVAAGFEPASGDNSLTPAEWYDSAVRDLGFTSRDSVIDEELAKEAWLNVLDELEKRNISGQEVAREIAEELGWC